MMLHYKVVIYWSSEDEAFIAEVPELAGCIQQSDVSHSLKHLSENAQNNRYPVTNDFGLL